MIKYHYWWGDIIFSDKPTEMDKGITDDGNYVYDIQPKPLMYPFMFITGLIKISVVGIWNLFNYRR